MLNRSRCYTASSISTAMQIASLPCSNRKYMPQERIASAIQAVAVVLFALAKRSDRQQRARSGNLDRNRVAGLFNAVVLVEIDQGRFKDAGFLL